MADFELSEPLAVDDPSFQIGCRHWFDAVEKRYLLATVGSPTNANGDRKVFTAAGQGPRRKVQIERLQVGDLVFPNIVNRAYVGIGRVTARACHVMQFLTEQGRRLVANELSEPCLFTNADSVDSAEYLVRVQWITTAPRENGLWKKTSGLLTTQLVTASLAAQEDTIRFVEQCFGVDTKN